MKINLIPQEVSWGFLRRCTLEKFIISSEALKHKRFDDNYWNPILIETLCLLEEKYDTILSLDEVADIYIGKAGVRTFVDSGVRYLTIKNYNSYKILTDKLRYVEPNGFNDTQSSRIKNLDILFSISGTLGKTMIVKNLSEITNISQDISIVRCKDLSEVYSLYFYLQSIFVKNQIERYKNGTGIQHLNKNYVKSLLIPKFSPKQNKYYEKKYNELMDILARNGEEKADEFINKVIHTL